MKINKILLGAYALALCFSCSNDEVTDNTTTANLDVTIEAIASEQASTDINGEYKGAINPITFTPESRFNETSKGMYHGIVVSSDRELHGQIWINLENDGKYNATVVTDTGDKLSFFANMGRGPSITSFATIAFVGERGSFTYNVSDYNHPVATNVVIDAKESFIQSVKDRSNQRAASVLGTFVDFADPSFAGTWDLVTDGTPETPFFGLPKLTLVCIVSPLGDMYTDDTFETYDYPCFGVTGVAPVFHTAGGPFGNLNEFIAQDQSMDILGVTNSYWIGQSTSISNGNPGTINAGFYNNDFADPPAAICTAINDQKGVWFWNGRAGSATFMDPFAVTREAQELPSALQAQEVYIPELYTKK